VQYHDVYPGVDLIYYGNQRQLEYDFVIAPGADPGNITLAFTGAQSVALDGDGNLVLHTTGGDVVEHAPVLYQDGPGGRQAVSGRYELQGGDQVGFRVGAYDQRRPLVLDPVLAYSSYLGGSGQDTALGIAVDAAGDAYVTGVTLSTDFPSTPGASQPTLHGPSDAYVVKVNPTGTALVFATYLGGSGPDGANAIAVDAAGNAYVTGQTGSGDFPTTPGAFQSINRGTNSNKAFVTKLTPTGTALAYSTYLGGSGDFASTFGGGIAVDAAGNAYVTGDTNAADFPTTPGAFQTTNAAVQGGATGFITKLNGTGTALIYSTFLGGTHGDAGESIAVDAAGNAYVTGVAGSTDFPTTPGAFQTTFRGPGGDGFVAKLNPTGTALAYSSYLSGGGAGDIGKGIAVDAAGNAYVTGQTNSADFPTTPGAFQTTFRGGSDAFVVEVNPTGAALVYATYLGGSGNQDGQGVALDSAGNAYVTGETSSADFPITPGAFQTTNRGIYNGYVAKLNPMGSALVYNTYLGGTGQDAGLGIAVDAAGNAYVTGDTNAADFPTTPGAFQTTHGGGYDAFVAKIAFQGATTTGVSSSPDPSVYGQTVTFTATVSAGDSPVTTGTVTFREGSTVLASAVVLDSSGHAHFTTANLTPGASPHLITADYSGSPQFAPSSGSVSQTVNRAPLTAAGQNFAATAGAPFSGAVATFTNADPFGNAASYIASINWGDDDTSAGVVSGAGTLTVTGSHTYADPINETVHVTISHKLGYTTTATTTGTAFVTSLGFGQTQDLDYWRDDDKGQALIKSFNGGPNATALSTWLATTFPKLFGAQAETDNLTGETNAQVTAFLTADHDGNTVVPHVLATALNVYATTWSLGGTAGEAAGFQVTLEGLGARSYSVGNDGPAFGVPNNTSLTVSQLLAAVNNQAVGGVLYNGNHQLQEKAQDLLETIDKPGRAGVLDDQTATIDFWHSGRGQALLASFNGAASETALSSWLATNFTNLYGTSAGSHNLTGQTNAQVATFFQGLFAQGHDNPDAQVLATALNVYATTTSLGGAQGLTYGFGVTAQGLGASSFNVHQDGAAFGVVNGTTLNVFQLLKAVNRRAVNGLLYNGDAHLRDLAEDLFERLNRADD
jgi:hypothetical protein